MQRVMARTFGSLLIGLGALTVSSGVARAEFTLYDDFKSPTIDPEKWRGSSLDTITTRFVREARGGGLRLALDSYGSTASDSGQTVARNSLAIQMRTPFVTGLQARAKVVSASAQDCVANPTGGSSQARLLASFFNDGSSPDPATNQTGNVFGILALRHHNDGTRSIAASLLRATSADGEATEQLPGSPLIFSSTWSFNRAIPLTMSWDRAAKLVRYTVGAGRSVETHTLAYTQSDASRPAGADFKHVRAQNFAENCTATGTRNHIDVIFDNVAVEREAP